MTQTTLTSTKGDITEAKILAALAEAGYTVLLPWGNCLRYDLAFEDSDGRLFKVQCKTGRYRNGCVEFNAYSYNRNSQQGPRSYVGQVDFYGVYCPELTTAYLVPVSSINGSGVTKPLLRIDATRNNQSANIRWAKDFQI